MVIGFQSGRLGRLPRQAGAILCMVFLALNAGCGNLGSEQPPPDDGDDPPDDNGVVTTEIISPTTGFGVSALEAPISVLYSLDESATDVQGFYVPVADGSLNSAPIGPRVITATNLAVGALQVFSFDPEEAGVGYFRVGIEFNLNGVEDDAESQAVIQVQGSPNPIFIQPAPGITEVTQGTDVTISFDNQDPEGAVQWRLFYLSESDSRIAPADQLGTALATGSGNPGSFLLTTFSLIPGDYQLGVSATDSGSSISATVADGESDQIVTIPRITTPTPIIRVTELSVPLPPTITITTPGATNVTIQSNQSFTIQFVGQVFEPGATGTIEVFRDGDDQVGNGFNSIAANLPVSTTSVPFPTDLPPGTYFIGATIFDGLNAAVTDYATGRVIVAP